jgi:hypothetical protein
MKPGIPLFHIGALQISMRFSVVPTAIVLTSTFVIFLALIGFPAVEAVAGGFLMTLALYAAGLLHHIGHALAAARTGHPMAGVVFYLMLGQSLYPPDEGPLPPQVHIQRALGGPIMSGVVALATGAVALLLSGSSGLAYWIALFTAATSLLAFCWGAMLPVVLPGGAMTDGYVIFVWARRQG